MGVAFHTHTPVNPGSPMTLDEVPAELGCTPRPGAGMGRTSRQGSGSGGDVKQSAVVQQYEPPGPVGAAYIESTHPIPIIMGPAGSGKTIASAFKGPYLATNWFPVCRDGVVRVKLTVLRPTYRDLARTALESWHNERLFPEKHPWTVEYTGGIDRPVIHRLRWKAKRGADMVDVDFIAQFAAIGDAEPEQFAKGYETSCVWLNECDLFSDRIPGLMFSRTGRYPSMDQISPSELNRVMGPYSRIMAEAGIKLDADDVLLPRILWGDCNPPDPDNWVPSRLIEEPEKWKLYKLFRQPSGLSPLAENRKGKPRSAYEQDLQTMTKNDARRFVHGEIGYALDGTPVYQDDFSTFVHRSDQPLAPVPGLPLGIGIDAGGSPAAVIGQHMPNGQARVLKEIVSSPGTGAVRFSRMLLDCLLTHFPGMPIGEAFGDPSAWYGADKANGELAWMEMVARALSINIQPAPSNEPSLRHDAVRYYLGLRIDGNTPGLLIDPGCRKIVGGFAAHYKLTKKASGSETDNLAVAKNEYSHPHDALQYWLLGHRGRYAMISEAAKQAGRTGNVVPIRGNVVRPADFNVFG